MFRCMVCAAANDLSLSYVAYLNAEHIGGSKIVMFDCMICVAANDLSLSFVWGVSECGADGESEVVMFGCMIDLCCKE